VTIGDLLHVAVFACAAYLCAVYATYAGLMLVGFAESRRRRREREREDLVTSRDSRFFPPVSIVVAAHNEAGSLPDAVHSLLGLEYPEFEVIVVNDGSTDDTLERLFDAFELVPVDALSRDVVATERIAAYYRGVREPRLLVVDKEGGGKADALNAGLNHSRHRYVCGVDADTVFARNALSATMQAFLADPDVVGLTSLVEIAADPSASLVRGVHYRIPDTRPLIVYQALDYLRAFLNNRIAWSRFDFMLCAVGAFQIWRRDLLDELRGWSRDYTCEDIELTFRVHKVMRDRGRRYRVLCLPDRVGLTEGPDTVRKLVAQRERWQRVILETWWAYRRMCLNPRYGSVGLVGMPFYLVSEIVAPVFEMLAVSTLVVGAATGLVDWWLAAFIVLLIAFVNSLFSTGALLMADLEFGAWRSRELLRVLALMPAEMLFYRPIASWARVKGTWRFLRGDKAWHKFERNVRAEVT
jgi:cellulose synthase/poly-beta-1,6-N-acetylglucosamine synthase-like glycosyltransferase